LCLSLGVVFSTFYTYTFKNIIIEKSKCYPREVN
jgi:hypothetical protein